VVRSPDGESRAYSIGQLSIQRAAVWVLEHYYTEFPIYNPYLERLPVSKSRKGGSSFKFYDVDGMNNTSLQVKCTVCTKPVLSERQCLESNTRGFDYYVSTLTTKPGC